MSKPENPKPDNYGSDLTRPKPETLGSAFYDCLFLFQGKGANGEGERENTTVPRFYEAGDGYGR